MELYVYSPIHLLGMVLS